MGWQAVLVTSVDQVPFEEVDSSDLVVDRTYRGGTANHFGDDPIARILPVGISGGFRFTGSVKMGTVSCLVLYTSTEDPDWPDRLDRQTGTFTYYGDNKTPGTELHHTPKLGNLLLRQMFENAISVDGRHSVPPILLFEKAGRGRDVRFLGLLVPGSTAIPEDEQLVAVWRTRKGQRFQNYRATFSVLDVQTVRRTWLNQILAGDTFGSEVPQVWKRWVSSGVARRLEAPNTILHRTHEEQMPHSVQGRKVLECVRRHFETRPHDFEKCAIEIWQLIAPATEELIQTQPSRDGGRDAIGYYRIGPPADQIQIDFALEAKCYLPDSPVGVKDVSRLISRLRHRQFGVLVTTSFVGPQAYKEIRDDQHPVVVVSGADIVATLEKRGWATPGAVQSWLDEKFPLVSTPDLAWTNGLAVEVPSSVGVPEP